LIEHSLVQGSGGSGAWDTDLGDDGGGNIDENPLFVDAIGMDNIAGTMDDDLRLQTGSPAIDAGDNSLVPLGVTTDLDGNPRIVDGDGDTTETVDMGAYEFQLVPPTSTPTDSPTATSTPTPTATNTILQPDTHTPTRTNTGAPTETHTETPTETDTGVVTATDTAAPTITPTPTVTDTGAATATTSATSTQTGTGVPTATDTATLTITETPTHTDIGAFTATKTPTPTATEEVDLGNCNMNSDNEIDADDLILLIESDPSDPNPFFFFARCWFEVLP